MLSSSLRAAGQHSASLFVPVAGLAALRAPMRGGAATGRRTMPVRLVFDRRRQFVNDCRNLAKTPVLIR
jgi:hypothetical protein